MLGIGFTELLLIVAIVGLPVVGGVAAFLVSRALRRRDRATPGPTVPGPRTPA